MPILNFGSRGLSFFARTYEKGTSFDLCVPYWPLCDPLWFVTPCLCVDSLWLWPPWPTWKTKTLLSAWLTRPSGIPVITPIPAQLCSPVPSAWPCLYLRHPRRIFWLVQMTGILTSQLAMYVKISWHVLKFGPFLFSLHLLRHLEFWEKLQFLPFLWEVHNNPYGLSLSPDRESTLQPPSDDSLVAPTALTSHYSQFGGAIDSDQVRKLAFCFSSSSFFDQMRAHDFPHLKDDRLLQEL